MTDPPEHRAELRGQHARLEALGAVLAGGRSARFGAPKALAPVGGVALLRRVADVLAETVAHTVLISHLEGLETTADLPRRPDLVRGVGPVGGLLTALAWARELELPGVLCVACDMPFLRPTLLRFICESGLRTRAQAVVPMGSETLEPLCAWYSVSALPVVERAAERRQGSLRYLLDELDARFLQRDALARFGDPAVLFLNVNTPDAHRRAEAIASLAGAS